MQEWEIGSFGGIWEEVGDEMVGLRLREEGVGGWG